MNLKNYFLIFTLLLFSTVITLAQPTIYSQLCTLNEHWKFIEPKAELLKQKQFSSEKEIITYHLQQVEKHLTKKNTEHLPLEIKQYRAEGIAALHKYWQRALYPKNNQFNYRLPLFIDDYNTACAVGYIMQGTGNVALANHIAETKNNAYVKEMVDKNILDWAKAYGFTVDELALIQPTYGPCFLSPVYVRNKTLPTCGNSDGIIEIEGSEIISFEWEHGANSLQLNNLSAGFYNITGTYKDDYYGDNQECPFKIEIILENENSADLTIDILKKQSCEEIEDGMAEVIVSNANGNYNIEWSNGANTTIASNLTKGYHTVIVTDEMGCTAIKQYFLGINSPLISNEVVSGTECNNNTGSTNLNVKGGSKNGIYTVEWMDGNTLENRANMKAGNYSVVIIDDDGCSIEKNIVIYDDCNGKIDCKDDYIKVNNVDGAYMFQFANDEDPIDGAITSLEIISQPKHVRVSAYNYRYVGKKLYESNMYTFFAGNTEYVGLDSFAYTVCTNSGFCDSATVHLDVVNEPVISIDFTNADTIKTYLGDTIELRMRGAEKFSWSPKKGLNLDDIMFKYVLASPTETTTYTITGTNADGKTDTRNLTIEVVEIPNIEAFNNGIQINKDFDNKQVYIKGQLQMVDITILDSADNVLLNPSTKNNELTIDFSDFENGLYYLIIQHLDYPDVNTTTILKR